MGNLSNKGSEREKWGLENKKAEGVHSDKGVREVKESWGEGLG